jgi:aspartate aminotransferase/aminotransferase
MSGWRIGYAISNKKIINKLLILNQQLITCAPTLLQIYIEKYFYKIINNNKVQIKELLEKRQKINKFLIKNDFNFINSDCTFYLFLKTKKNNFKFSNYLIDRYGISVVPGKFYGSNSKNYVRISLGVEPFNKIIKSLKIIKKYI